MTKITDTQILKIAKKMDNKTKLALQQTPVVSSVTKPSVNEILRMMSELHILKISTSNGEVNLKYKLDLEKSSIVL
jgi:hypothetical protein